MVYLKVTSRQLSIILFLGIGLVHGLIYIFIVPPWQHNDEPNHFEYAWLIAHRNYLPGDSDSDPYLSRQVVQSMVAHNFFDGMGYTPDLTPGVAVNLIGYSQLTDPPLYYLIASIPIRFVEYVAPAASIETLLYATRGASLILFLISLLAAYGFICELTSPANPLRWLVPITLALWPGFIDVMTAVTNIAGEVLFFSLFLWFGTRLIRRGLSWFNILGAVSTCVACCYTLSSGVITLPLLFVAVIFTLFHGRWWWFSWVLMLLGVFLGSLAVFTWGDADLWYRETWQTEPTTLDRPDTPLGKKAIQLIVPPKRPENQMYQLIPRSNARELTGKTITLGAWIWATRPIRINSPGLAVDDGDLFYASDFSVSEIPAYYAITVTLAANSVRSWVILSVPVSGELAGTAVFFDGVVLAEGLYPLDEAPRFTANDGSQGLWGDKPFKNLVRNPSGEVAGPRIRSWIDQHLLFVSYGRFSMVLYAIRDWSGAGWYYRVTTANLIRTVWARFGWNHVSLLGHKPYRGLLAVSILGLFGAVAAVWRVRKRVLWKLFIWLGLALCMLGFVTVERGVFYLWFHLFIPSGRYLFPVMIIIVTTLSAGWWEILRIFKGCLSNRVRTIIYLSMFLCFDVYALVSLASFYY
jgi:hypothetical protein